LLYYSFDDKHTADVSPPYYIRVIKPGTFLLEGRIKSEFLDYYSPSKTRSYILSVDNKKGLAIKETTIRGR